jgi:hypothetical protein
MVMSRIQPMVVDYPVAIIPKCIVVCTDHIIHSPSLEVKVGGT